MSLIHKGLGENTRWVSQLEKQENTYCSCKFEFRLKLKFSK